jgi:hypothetical protein
MPNIVGFEAVLDRPAKEFKVPTSWRQVMSQANQSASNGPNSNLPAHPSQQPKLLERLRGIMEQERFDAATNKRFVKWNRRRPT